MKIKYLVIHCTATPEGRHVAKEDVIKWHTGPKEEGHRGWKKAGYSDIIYLDGSLHNIHPFDQDETVDHWEITNGVRGINGAARHVCYVGGCDSRMNPKDTRTIQQDESLATYCRYMVLRHPDIQIAGHNQFANKACPSFDVIEFCRAWGIPEKNIYTP